MWEQVETAVRDLAIRRGWPHESLEDLDLAVRRLDEENPDLHLEIRVDFPGCQLYRGNLRFQHMDLHEIKF